MLKTCLAAGVVTGMLAFLGSLVGTQRPSPPGASLGYLGCLGAGCQLLEPAERTDGQSKSGLPVSGSAVCLAENVQVGQPDNGPAELPVVEPPGEAAGLRTVEVQLTDGRRYVARLDWRTNSDALWLRWQRGEAYILRAIAWPEITGAKVAGESLAADQLRTMVQQVRREIPLPGSVAVKKTVELRGLWPADQSDHAPASRSGPASERPSAPPRVSWLQIEVQAADWDADVETDGLLVYLRPRDQSGRIVPVRGTVQVELWARRWGVVKQSRPYGRIGHWSPAISPHSFTLRGAALRLPFQSVHPEFAADLDPLGAVHVRLAVPGQGVFEATDAMVRLRPYSAVRDRMQQATGKRFLPRELTGRR